MLIRCELRVLTTSVRPFSSYFVALYNPWLFKVKRSISYSYGFVACRSDLAEAVKFVKGQGFSKEIVPGHSLGVAAAMCAADSVPNEIAGLVLLSGAYESRKAVSTPIPFMKKMKLLSSAIIRPSYRAVNYNREGMTVSEDTLFNFRYTPRFVIMQDVSKLRLPSSLNIPVLVGVGHKDELFEIDKVKELYNLVPGTKKEYFIMKNATHAKIPLESWEEIARWLDKTFVG